MTQTNAKKREWLENEIGREEFVLQYYDSPVLKKAPYTKSMKARCKRKIKLLKSLLELYPK